MEPLVYAMEPEPTWFPGPHRVVWGWPVGNVLGNDDWAETPEDLQRAGRSNLAPPLIGMVWTDGDALRLSVEQGVAVIRVMHRRWAAFAWSLGTPRWWYERQLRWSARPRPASASQLPSLWSRLPPPGEQKPAPLWDGKPWDAAEQIEGMVELADGRRTRWGAVRLDETTVHAAAGWLRGHRWIVSDRAGRWPDCALQLATEFQLEGKEEIDVVARLVSDGEVVLRFGRFELSVPEKVRGRNPHGVRDAAIVYGGTGTVWQFMQSLADAVPAEAAEPRDFGLVAAEL